METVNRPTSWLDYPEDILHAIFGLLSPDDLRVICLASESLCMLAQPVLYSKFEWEWQDAGVPRIVLLLRSILRRPKLGAHVKSVTLSGNSFYNPWYRASIPKISLFVPDLEGSAAFIEKLRVEHGAVWIRELRNGTMDAFVALLVSLLPNLSKLCLGPNFARDTQLLGLLFRSTLSKPESSSHFAHLRHVSFRFRVNPYVPKSIKNTQDMLPLFYLPSVQHISAVIDDPDEFKWPIDAPSCPSPANLRSLELVSIREAHLRDILSVTRGLTSLQWQWSHYPNLRSATNTPVFDLDQISHALAPAQATLETLTISATTTPEDGITYAPLRSHGTLKALVNFGRLRRFEVPLVFLTGWMLDETRLIQDCLPRNVEHLVITDDLKIHDEYEWDECTVFGLIQAWLGDWQSSTPDLRELTLLLRIQEEDYDPDARNRLKEFCAQAGVAFNMP